MAQLQQQRDFAYPQMLKMLRHRVELLRKYAAMGPEQQRRALAQIFGIENSLKALGGEYEGLLDKNLVAKKTG